MSFGENGYKFGEQNPFKPFQGLGSKLGGLMDAHRDVKNIEENAKSMASGAALQTHLNLEAGMIDREHMVHVFGEQLKPHMKEGSQIKFQSGNHNIEGTFAGGEPADAEGEGKPDGEANGGATPANGGAAPAKTPRKRGPAKPKAPLVFQHTDTKGNVTGTSTQVFPPAVNVQNGNNANPQGTTPTKGKNASAVKANSTAKPAAKPAAKSAELTPAQKRAATIAAKKKAAQK